MRTAFLLFSLLAGCDTIDQVRGAADVADANARSALAEVESLRSRTSDLEATAIRLEGKISELEAEIHRVRQGASSDQAVHDEIYGNLNRLFDLHNRLNRAYNNHTH